MKGFLPSQSPFSPHITREEEKKGLVRALLESVIDMREHRRSLSMASTTISGALAGRSNIDRTRRVHDHRVKGKFCFSVHAHDQEQWPSLSIWKGDGGGPQVATTQRREREDVQ